MHGLRVTILAVGVAGLDVRTRGHGVYTRSFWCVLWLVGFWVWLGAISTDQVEEVLIHLQTSFGWAGPGGSLRIHHWGALARTMMAECAKHSTTVSVLALAQGHLF